LETVDDPENHIAIDFDHWQCTKCHEGYPALEEYRECMKNQEGQICRVGSELHSFRIGEKKDFFVVNSIAVVIEEPHIPKPPAKHTTTATTFTT
jgi:hypothetical protein